MQETVSLSAHKPTLRPLVTSRQIGSMTKWPSDSALGDLGWESRRIKYLSVETKMYIPDGDVAIKQQTGGLRWKHATYLHCAVQEAAVLSRLIEKSFGRSQGQHRPRLVAPAEIAPWFPEELYPCHLIAGGKCAFQPRGILIDEGLELGPWTGWASSVWGYVIPQAEVLSNIRVEYFATAKLLQG